MRNRSKLALAALTAAVALGALVAAASANRIALSSQGFRVTWDNSANNSLLFEGGIGFGAVNCPVTIEGSFHSRTISKVTEALIGYVTKVSVANEPGNASGACTGGSARILPASLPWHIRYDSFIAERGLPFIEGIKLRLVGAAFLVQNGFGACLFQSTAASPMKGIINRNTTTGAVVSLQPEGAPIPRFATLSGFCPASGFLEHTSKTATVQGGTAAITVTLVA